MERRIPIDEIRQNRRLFEEPGMIDLATGKAKLDINSSLKGILNWGKKKVKDKTIKALDYVTRGRGQDTYDMFSDRFYQWKYGKEYLFVKDVVRRVVEGDNLDYNVKEVPYAQLARKGRMAEHKGYTVRIPMEATPYEKVYMRAHEIAENQYMRNYKMEDMEKLPAETEGKYEAMLLSALRTLARDGYKPAGKAYKAALEIHSARGRNDRFLSLTKKYNTELGPDLRALKLVA